MPRKILHLDLDAFFCAVEEQRDPSLRGKAFAVGGSPDSRGVVTSCSYPARKFGVRSAMPMTRAVKLCPGLLTVSGRRGNYSQVSKRVMKRLHNLTPLVEQISIDEAFLDVSDIPTSGETLARQLQIIIRSELGLPCSLGIATNKLVAKIATDVGKVAASGEGSPNAITVVPPGEEASFLAPLPVNLLWGVGPKTAIELEKVRIRTIGDLAEWSAEKLTRRFGKLGQSLATRSRGIDNRPIVTTREAKSISNEVTFSTDIQDGETLRRTLRTLSERVGRRLRKAHLCGATVRLKIRWPDFSTLTRQETLSQPIDQDNEIYIAAIQLLEKVWYSGRFVRLIGVGVSGLGPPIRQLGLWDTGLKKERQLQIAVDELRERYGNKIIRRGSQLEQKYG